MSAITHTDWSTAGFDLPPFVEATGPFSGRPMLKAWWSVRGSGEALFLESAAAFIPLHRVDNAFHLLGEADLFDYHTPRGSGVAALVAEWARELPAGTSLDLDSLPAEAADEFMTGLSKAGLSPTAEMHESAAVLHLDGDYDAYLAALHKKQRHETRRKGRRFTEILGEPRLVRADGSSAVANFAAMHRLSDGRKGQFMSEAMEQLFARLHASAGAVVDFLCGDGDEPVAAAFGFEDESGYFLYNSAYAPEAGAASPGIVLVSELIRRTIHHDHRRFDFLKGDEVYKYRLGAVARPLWRVSATVGDAR